MSATVNIMNHSGYELCVADDQVQGDPDLDHRYSRGWSCTIPGGEFVYSVYGRITIAAFVATPNGPVDYVARHPSGRSTSSMPLPTDVDVTQGWALYYYRDDANVWHYRYRLHGDDAFAEVQSAPNPSWVPGLAPIGFQAVKGWDFLEVTDDGTTVTVGPP